MRPTLRFGFVLRTKLPYEKRAAFSSVHFAHPNAALTWRWKTKRGKIAALGYAMCNTSETTNPVWQARLWQTRSEFSFSYDGSTIQRICHLYQNDSYSTHRIQGRLSEYRPSQAWRPESISVCLWVHYSPFTFTLHDCEARIAKKRIMIKRYRVALIGPITSAKRTMHSIGQR